MANLIIENGKSQMFRIAAVIAILIVLIRQGLLIKDIKSTDPPGFEPGPEAPEASILSRLYYESMLLYFLSGRICSRHMTGLKLWNI